MTLQMKHCTFLYGNDASSRHQNACKFTSNGHRYPYYQCCMSCDESAGYDKNTGDAIASAQQPRHVRMQRAGGRLVAIVCEEARLRVRRSKQQGPTRCSALRGEAGDADLRGMQRPAS
eukprot:6026446-Pleurochrysis_carterae.AAC.2